MGATLLCPLALCLPLLFCCAAGSPLQTPNTAPTRTAVSPPFNLVMDSYNFNTTLYWDYVQTSVTPRFTVQIRCYMSGKTFLVETCRNITEHFCDLSQHITKPEDYFWGQVKAIVGDEESDYAESKSFHLREQGKIGPPTLNVKMDEKEVLVEVYHPVIYFKTNRTLLDIYDDFTYIVYLGEKKLEFEDDECDTEACNMYVAPPEKGVVLCIVAKGFSKSWGLSSEKSKETCLNVTDDEPGKVHRYNLAMVVGFSLFAVVLVVLGMVFIYKVLQRKNIKLPKSLAFLALNHGGNFSGANPTPEEEVSPVSVINEREHLLDQPPKWEMIDESPVQVAADGSQTSMGNSSLLIPDGAEEIPDEYAAPNSSLSNTGKENCFISDTSSTETGSVTSSSEPMHTPAGEATEKAPPQAAVRESFGYDKPHAPLSLSAQEGDSAEYPEPVH